LTVHRYFVVSGIEIEYLSHHLETKKPTNMKVKQVFFTIAISALTAFGVMWGYNKVIQNNNTYAGQEKGVVPVNYKYAGLFDNNTPPGAVDFSQPAAAALPTVVHIKTKTNAKQVSNNLPKNQRPKNPFSDFFGDDMLEEFFGNRKGYVPEQRASGSGVIISADGYIVTNNHVVENADELQVTLSNKKSYTGKVVGRDPAYDLAVIKIEATGLPFLLYGNSDDVRIGQWVLALGYPLNLETTVTAGIVSAKARHLGLNRATKTNTPVESFIQTDAAVNQGNSGGALINTNGELIGVNSAILAPSGTYAGYSFAIPVNIIKKIVNDIIQYGDVQRGYLGVSYYPTDDVPEEQLKSLGIPTNVEGVYVSSVSSDGGAAAAGIKKGDVITKVNNARVTSGLQMSAQIAGFRPGDKVPVTYVRAGKEVNVNVILKKKTDVINSNLGTRLKADLSTLGSDKAAKYGVDGGVVVNKIFEDSPLGRARIQPGFVIISVAGQEVSSVEELTELVSNLSGTVKVEGVYPGNDMPYSYPVNLDQ
jgi:Do/DeqQ family serine protease